MARGRWDAHAAEIIREYQGKKSVKEIKAAYGIRDNVLYALLRRHGVPTRRRRDLPVGRVVRLYTQAHMSTTQIARMYRVAPERVSVLLKAEGVIVRRRTGASVVTAEKAAQYDALRAQGRCHSEIAALFRLHPGTLRRALKNLRGDAK
jgi:phage antirepressor YoqD-like protein